MNRFVSVSLFLGLSAALAQAHFPFILPESAGTSAKVVFSDELSVDKDVKVEKIANTKLIMRDSQGKETALEWKKETDCYTVALPGSGTRVVYGVTDYGVLQKGDAKPFKLVYYPKAVVGAATPREATIGDKLALEVVPLSSFGKIKFQVLAAGKPLPDCEVTVLQPDGKKAAKTDKDGLTPEYEGPGRYGVVAKLIEAKSGDFAGKKFEEVRHYATLVVEFAK